MSPGGRVERRGIPLHEDVGLTQAATAHTRAVKDEDVLERADLENSVAANGGRPEIAPEVPVAPGEVAILEAAAPLQDHDPIALLRQSHGGDAAAEARADDD